MADILHALAMQSAIANPKFVLIRDSDSAYWSTAGTPAFEAYNASNIANYGITATEIGSTGVYKATNPAETTPAMMLFVAAAGASLVVADIVANVRYEGDAGPGRAVNTSDAPLATAAALTTVAGDASSAAASGTAIKAKTDQLTFTTPTRVDATASLTQASIDSIGESIADQLGDNPIRIQSPTTGDGRLDLVQGMDYYTADGREIEFTFVRDYVPSSCKLTIASGEVVTVTSTDISESSGSGSGRFHVRFQLARTDGDNLDAGPGSFEVFSVVGARQVPEIAEGVATIRRRLTA